MFETPRALSLPGNPLGFLGYISEFIGFPNGFSVQRRYLSRVLTKVASVLKLYSQCPLSVLGIILALFTPIYYIT